MTERLDQLFERMHEPDETTPSHFAFLRHLDRTQHLVQIELEADALPPLHSWLERNLGVVEYANGEFTDHQGRLLFSPSRPTDPKAQPPRPVEALQRRERTTTRLKSVGLEVPTHLPVVLAEPELRLREPREIGERCLALLLVALRGESLGGDEPIPLNELKQLRPESFAYLTAEEQGYLEDEKPLPEASIAMSWRYESLLTLLWAVNLAELPSASEACDVASLLDKLLSLDEADLLNRAQLRHSSILLDTLDLVFCQHWLTRQADPEFPTALDTLDPGIVYERHYALSWLTRFEPCDWDDICVPT